MFYGGGRKAANNISPGIDTEAYKRMRPSEFDDVMNSVDTDFDRLMVR
jgi:hypothetical protein